MTTMDDVAAHVRWLCDQGMTQRQIGNLLGIPHSGVSRVMTGERVLAPRMADHVLRLSPDDVPLAGVRAPDSHGVIEEEYDHFVVRLGWPDTDFAALMADDLGLAYGTVMTQIRAIQRARSPVGLSRREAELLADVGFTGELSRRLGKTTQSLEGRGFIETFVWRCKGNVRCAVLTDEGAEALRRERDNALD